MTHEIGTILSAPKHDSTKFRFFVDDNFILDNVLNSIEDSKVSEKLPISGFISAIRYMDRIGINSFSFELVDKVVTETTTTFSSGHLKINNSDSLISILNIFTKYDFVIISDDNLNGIISWRSYSDSSKKFN